MRVQTGRYGRRRSGRYTRRGEAVQDRRRAEPRLRHPFDQPGPAPGHTVRDIAQARPVGPGVGPEGGERLAHREAGVLGEDALRLLDHDPAVEGGLQLVGEQACVLGGTLLDQSDRGDVGEGLRGVEVGRRSPPAGCGGGSGSRSWTRAAASECPGGPEPGAERLGRGPGQRSPVAFEILGHDQRPVRKQSMHGPS